LINHSYLRKNNFELRSARFLAANRYSTSTMSKPLVQENEKFFTENFEGLTLKSPLFYNWDASLRFDLQPNTESTVSGNMSEYFQEVQNRAIKIFESIFTEQDKIQIVLYQFKGRSRKKIKLSNFVFKQISDLCKSEAEFSVIRRLYEPNDNDDIWNRAIIKTMVANLNYKEILKAISYTDFPSNNPSIQFETYIVNISKKIIFHMYDDRGLDVVASDKKSLAPIYYKHKNWLLDYDIEMMHERIKDIL